MMNLAIASRIRIENRAPSEIDGENCRSNLSHGCFFRGNLGGWHCFAGLPTTSLAFMLREVTASLQCLKALSNKLLCLDEVLFTVRALMCLNYQHGNGIRSLQRLLYC